MTMSTLPMELTDTKESDQSCYQPIIFTANSKEYFRIWIVNIALTVLTLGIYSAWAKVRRNRYFYTHTFLDKQNFDYHAQPEAILYGRVIAVSVLALSLLAGYLQPGIDILLFFVIFLISPWLIVRAKRFALYNTSYRGVRFGFEANYKSAFKTFYGAALVSVFSLGLATFHALFLKTRFITNHSKFGRNRFKYQGRSEDFLKIYFGAIGLALLGFLTLSVILGATIIPHPNTPDTTQYPVYIDLLIFAVMGAVYLFCFCFQRSRTLNHIYRTTSLKGIRFKCELSARILFWLYLSNVIAIIFSLGLLTPWASIRLARYRAQSLQVDITPDWETHLAAAQSQITASGEEFASAFDVDLGAGF